MKVLLFTHKNDIDGMGNAVLGKLAYDNLDFIFSSKYNWYYINNGKRVDVLGGTEHPIPSSILASISIYIKVTPTSTYTSNETQQTTQTPSSTSTLLTDSTTSYSTT